MSAGWMLPARPAPSRHDRQVSPGGSSYRRPVSTTCPAEAEHHMIPSHLKPLPVVLNIVSYHNILWYHHILRHSLDSLILHHTVTSYDTSTSYTIPRAVLCCIILFNHFTSRSKCMSGSRDPGLTIINPTEISVMYGYVTWRMTTEISVMYGSGGVNAVSYHNIIWYHHIYHTPWTV